MPDLMPQPKRRTVDDYYKERQRKLRYLRYVFSFVVGLLLVGSGALGMFIFYAIFFE